MQPKILIVDDEAPTREALKRTLRQDFEIIEADSAESALDILRQSQDVCIIVADERMPGKSGTELLSEVKVLYPFMVRVMISGHVQLEQMMNAVNKAELHRFLLKPWDNDVLRLQLQEALLHSRNLEEIGRLEKLSITDPVTGLTNHRYFQERIRQEAERASRHGRVFSLIMADVDNFKKFNDRYGHPEGDRALAQIARLLKTATRTADSISRYGGEEFAVILPETEKPGAAEVAERIREGLENAPVGGHKNNPHMVTVSLGVSTFPHDGKDVEQIIRAADQALYQAKEKGRNRVEVHP
jgi:diguanylate cyclase (GGDEF)-like protein